MKIDKSPPGYLAGHLLIATPILTDQRFLRGVILLCAHTPGGAMGVMVNRLGGRVKFSDLLGEVGVQIDPAMSDKVPIHFGGPVEPGRGFVLHSPEKKYDGTQSITDELVMTSTVDVLTDIAKNEGPAKSLLALGYAGWGPGQLDQEIQANCWLTIPASADFVFSSDLDGLWMRTLESLGVHAPHTIFSYAGHA